MMFREVTIGPCRLINADCMDVLPTLIDSSIDLIATDPPYFKVKGEWWDRQWDTADGFLLWLGSLCDEWKRILKPNGSLYCFASPQMAWGVEGEIRKRFNVLNQIQWAKHDGGGNGRWSQACKEDLRGFFPQREVILLAEQFSSDYIASNGAGYQRKCDEAARDVFGRYVTAVRQKHSLTMKDLTAAVGAHGAVNHGGACSNWENGFNVPTTEHYDTLQAKFPGCFDREYEDLRREYEDLRRPFSVTSDVPYTDVWDFPTVQAYDGKHPCEKPLAMMRHIVTASSKRRGIVFDGFAGSGSTAIACIEEGRQFIGCEVDEKYFKRLVVNVSDAWTDFNSRLPFDDGSEFEALPRLVQRELI